MRHSIFSSLCPLFTVFSLLKREKAPLGGKGRSPEIMRRSHFAHTLAHSFLFLLSAFGLFSTQERENIVADMESRAQSSATPPHTPPTSLLFGLRFSTQKNET